MDPLVGLVISGSLAVLFAASTMHKLAALGEWPGVVRNYKVLPQALAVPAAGLLLIAGALTAAALFWPVTRRLGAGAAAVQLVLFAAALAINLRRGRSRVDCGCFGSRLRQGIAAWMVVRNLVLAMLALGLLLPPTPRVLGALDITAAVAVIAIATFLYPVLDVVLRPPVATFAQNFEAAAAARRAH
jgi:hypothetical protein